MVKFSHLTGGYGHFFPQKCIKFPGPEVMTEFCQDPPIHHSYAKLELIVTYRSHIFSMFQEENSFQMGLCPKISPGAHSLTERAFFHQINIKYFR